MTQCTDYPIARGDEIQDPVTAAVMQEGEIIYMTPENFLTITPAPDWWTGMSAGYTEVERRIEQGEPVDVPYIQLVYNRMSHEGRHRALAAQNLGLDKIPVAVVKQTPTEEELQRASQMDKP